MKLSDPSLKALEILEILSESGSDGVGVSQITEITGISKSTVHRLINALANDGYVIRNSASKKYKLGYRILKISSSLTENLEIKRVARPYLEDLTKFSRETVHLVQLDGVYGVYVDKIDCPEPLGLLSKVGKQIMLHCTGAGKALFAYLPDAGRERVYNEVGLPKLCENTIIDRAAMEKELAAIRAAGVAFDRMEARCEIRCIAAPIFHQNGDIAGAFSIAGPAFRFSPEENEELIQLVKETSKGISKNLGYVSK